MTPSRTGHTPDTSTGRRGLLPLLFGPMPVGAPRLRPRARGMSTYAHELSHLLGIGDNYNNPYSNPARRDYSGPFSMLARGTFNGPGGPHTRWQIPAQQGSSLGSPHTMGDKLRINLVDPSRVLMISRAALPASGLVTAELTARVVSPSATQLMGMHISIRRRPVANLQHTDRPVL